MSLKEKSQGKTAEERNLKQRGAYISHGEAGRPTSSPKTVCPSTPPRETDARLSVPSSGERVNIDPDMGPASGRFLASLGSSPGYISLGLLNRTYNTSCSNIREQRGSRQMSIILCLDTPRVWGAYFVAISESSFWSNVHTEHQVRHQRFSGVAENMASARWLGKNVMLRGLRS